MVGWRNNIKYLPEIYAIIPARGGSKGLPRKNLRLLAGKPLIAHSILACLSCKKISRVIVSTEDPDIKSVSLDWGAEVIDRPVELASDSTLTGSVVLHVLETLKKESSIPEYFVLAQPTSPLRTASHLDSCLELITKLKPDCIISVTETEHHPYKSLRLESGALIPLFGINYLDKPRQELPFIYRQNGAIYVLKTETFLKTKRFFVQSSIPFVMNGDSSVDVDSELDLLIAEAIIARNNKKVKLN